MMTMMKMVKMKIKNTEDGKDEDVKIIVKMSMMMMKKFSHYDGYFVMKVILWWNFSRDESNPVMKVMIVNELMTGDISPVATFNFEQTMITGPRAKVADSSGSKSDQFEKSKLDKWSFFSLFFLENQTIDLCESLVLVFHPSMVKLVKLV